MEKASTPCKHPNCPFCPSLYAKAVDRSVLFTLIINVLFAGACYLMFMDDTKVECVVL
jgi:hypothetical protein